MDNLENVSNNRVHLNLFLVCEIHFRWNFMAFLLLARNKFRRYILRNRQPRRYCLSKSFGGEQHTGECTSYEIRYGEQTRFKLWSLDSGIPNYRNQVTRVCSYLQERRNRVSPAICRQPP